MREYRSHKIVRAGLITAEPQFSRERNGWEFRIEGIASVQMVTEGIGDRLIGMAEVAGKSITDGYLIEYEDGYISWSPADVFEAGYTPIDPTALLSFGDVLNGLPLGDRYARAGWNGADMFIYLVPGSVFGVNRPPLLGLYEEGHQIEYRPHIDMKTADGSCVPWVASQTDLLAFDWQLVE